MLSGFAEQPGTQGQHADVAMHAGLICVNGPVGIDAALQCELFAFALKQLGEAGQGSGLVNEVLGVFLDALDGKPELYHYKLPKSSRV